MDTPIIISILFLIAGIISLVWLFFTLRDMKKQQKGVQKYVLGWVVFLFIMGLVGLIPFTSPKVPFIVIQVVFLLLGILHVWLMKKVRPRLKDLSSKQHLLLTGCVYFLGAAGFMTMIYLLFILAGRIKFLKYLTYLPAGMTYKEVFTFTHLLFPLPIVFYGAFEAWMAIPKKLYKSWTYKKGPALQRKNIESVDKVYFTIGSDFTQSISLKKVPADISLEYRVGDFFYIFLDEYQFKNPTVKIPFLAQDADGNELSWVFYRKGKNFWEGDRFLDYEETFAYNEVERLDEILVYRIRGKVEGRKRPRQGNGPVNIQPKEKDITIRRIQ